MEVYIVYELLDEGADSVVSVHSTKERAETFIKDYCYTESRYYILAHTVDE